MAASSKMAVYAVSVSSGLSVAVPKYSLPLDLARVCSLTVDVDEELLAELVWDGEPGAEETEEAWLCAKSENHGNREYNRTRTLGMHWE